MISGIKLLVVEDEALTYMLYQMQYMEIGYNVCQQAVSGEEAVQIAEEEKPDVVLMDIGLCGEMDGIEAAEIIHSRFGLPIIFVTGYADENTRKRADKALPHSGYFIKPINPEAVIPAIESALEKNSTRIKRISTDKTK